MARTSAKAKKSKQEVNKKKEEDKKNEKTDSEGPGDSTDKENDSLNYDVEKITHTRMFKGKRQYLVRWKGYSEDNDTWENESVLQSCKEILDAFKEENLIDVNSDDEVSVKGDEKVKSTSKKVAKKVNKKKSGTTSKSKKEIEDSQTESEKEEEEKAYESDSNSNKKIQPKTTEKTYTEDSQSDSDTMEEIKEKNKTKGVKGKKRNAAKETGSSKAKKAKKSESDDESVTDGKDYEVEKIIEVHTRKDGSREFLIRWKGYKPSEDTWEPEAHLDCQELIEKFMEKVGKAKEMSRKELRENRTQTKRFVPVPSTGRGRASQRNRGFRPCYQESAYED